MTVLVNQTLTGQDTQIQAVTLALELVDCHLVQIDRLRIWA